MSLILFELSLIEVFISTNAKKKRKEKEIYIYIYIYIYTFMLMNHLQPKFLTLCANFLECRCSKFQKSNESKKHDELINQSKF